MRRSGSKIDSALAKKYEGLVDFETHSQLDLTIYILQKKYSKSIADLVNIRVNEIKSRPLLKTQYRSRWQMDYWYGRTDLAFDKFLEKIVAEEEDLNTVDSIVHFFEKRPWFGINIFEDLNELYKSVHGIEDKILEQLNVIKDDYCCEEPTEGAFEEPTPRPAYTTPSWFWTTPRPRLATTATRTPFVATLRPVSETPSQTLATTTTSPVSGSGDFSDTDESSGKIDDEDESPFDTEDEYEYEDPF